MFIGFTATTAVMQLSTIFVPIVHKESFKRLTLRKNINKPFTSRELLFLLEYHIYLWNRNFIEFDPQTFPF
jgi:hypothetical protein